MKLLEEQQKWIRSWIEKNYDLMKNMPGTFVEDGIEAFCEKFCSKGRDTKEMEKTLEQILLICEREQKYYRGLGMQKASELFGSIAILARKVI